MHDIDKLIFLILIRQSERIGELSQQTDELTTAVATLESDDALLKVQVAATVIELKGLETKVTELEAAGTISPEVAKELTDKINNAASGVTAATEALKNG